MGRGSRRTTRALGRPATRRPGSPSPPSPTATARGQGPLLTKEGRGGHSAIAPRHHDADAGLYEGHREIHDFGPLLVDGISGKSQVLFAVVFTARYLDLFTNYISLYNTCMKVVYIACSFTTVWMIYSKFKATYDGNHDTFRVEFLVIPTAILAFLVNHDFTPLEILWTFSIYLESVAILPQLFMVSKTGEAETITSHYLFALGVYRTLYLFNWIWRYHFEGFFDLIAIVAGLVQTVLYCDFFYLYITKVLKGKKLSLPA
uniref:ER lumen protein-retaining receptor n=1 Tax=Bos mutus grunniens TaxID=30521 RepID=A0A8B9YET9_BOSMU